MDRKKTAIKNSFISVTSGIIITILQFVVRSYFVNYLGVELLGISSTFTSVLNMISLAELGLQNSIIYHMYEPLANNDTKKINEFINILRYFYNFIGILFIAIGVALIPFLPILLKGVKVDLIVIVVFLLQVLNSATTYFWGYRRSLLFADKLEYISKIIDTIFNIIFSVLKIVAIVAYESFILYVALSTVQTFLSNIVIYIICSKRYKFLSRIKITIDDIRPLWNDMKNVFVSKIAGYIYGSTDNVIVSAIIGTALVGMMNNYTTIVGGLNGVVFAFFAPITPIIGNLIAEEKDKKHLADVLVRYTYIRFILAMISLVPLIVLVQTFITMWLGNRYLLPISVVILYAIDRYISYVHGALCDFIAGYGLFQAEKIVNIICAILNVTISIGLAYRVGIVGVLLGTAITQMIYWVGRSVILYVNCFQGLNDEYKYYWGKNLIYVVTFIITTSIAALLYEYLPITSLIARFIVGGVICELMVGVFIYVFFGRTIEHRELIAMVKSFIKDKKR